MYLPIHFSAIHIYARGMHMVSHIDIYINMHTDVHTYIYIHVRVLSRQPRGLHCRRRCHRLRQQIGAAGAVYKVYLSIYVYVCLSRSLYINQSFVC